MKLAALLLTTVLLSAPRLAAGQAVPAAHASEPSSSAARTDDSARTAGWLTAGAGAVGIGFGAAFGIIALKKKSDAGDHCDDANRCEGEGLALQRDGVRAGTISTVTMIAGLALVGTGVSLVLLAPRVREGTPVRSARVVVGPTGASLVGSF
jgi:hypothetical protein